LPPFWVEWRFLSNHRLGNNQLCDADFLILYRGFFDGIYMFGDAVLSADAGTVLRRLPINEFRSYRFETLDGNLGCFYVDGRLFTCETGGGTGYGMIQMIGSGGCDLAQPATVNEWDFVRYGTISYGEKIVASDPPAGFVDARTHAPLDRFTVTYDSSNYVYLDEISVDVSGGVAPAVIATRRLDNGPPETVEIVLDRPIPYNATTRFTFNDGVAVNTVEYTFAPGDTDGDGDADLADFAAFQNCFEVSPISGACLVFDFNADHSIDLLDFAALQPILSGQ